VTETALGRETAAARDRVLARERLGSVADASLRSLGPLALSLLVGGALVAALGRSPFTFYANVYRGGIELTAWQDSIMRMAPLLLIAAGLIVVFRANIWNIGVDGQFLLAAVIVAGVGPALESRLANTLTLILLVLLAAAVGALWTLVPALLKARYHVNEIITTLMMTFIAIDLSQMLIKGPFFDETIPGSPQTRSLPLDAMLPSVPGTRIHVGILVAVAAVLVVWFAMSRTSFGLRLRVLGANPRAASHLGLSVARLTVVAFLISGGLVGVAAATEILGIWGYTRQDWNPGFGLQIVPLIFLARRQ
jgi:simple sugar transport system permease protein